jgi:uroporphyrinogen-III synthase
VNLTVGKPAGNEPETDITHDRRVAVGALSGFSVAVTADRRREEQAKLLERRGATVLLGPVIRTLPLDVEASLRDATESLIKRPPDIVVLTTGLGVRSWFAAAESLDLGADLLGALRPARVLARGPKAAGAAITAGLDIAWQAPDATGQEIVEHLVTIGPRDSAGGRARVAVQLDGAKEAVLASAIESLGYEVVGVRVYRWTLPEDRVPAARLVSAVADRAVDAVTFTSAHAIANFLSLADEQGARRRVIDVCCRGEVLPVCVGPVSASRARALGLGDPVQPTHPRLGAMVQALVGSFVGRSRALDLNGTQVLVQGRLIAVGNESPVSLTDRERAVLDVLACRPGVVVSKETLLRTIWPDQSDDHVVEVTIGRLRRRLGPAGAAIETVMRRGYRLAIT